jgi:hypothetical protein
MPRVRSAVYALVAVLALAFAAGCKEEKGLRITGIDPATGSHAGNTTVTINGSGFQEDGAKGVTVRFGDREGRVLGFVGDGQLKVETPPGDAGKTVDVLVVFDDSKSLMVEKAYTYTDTTGSLSVDALGDDKKPASK